MPSNNAGSVCVRGRQAAHTRGTHSLGERAFSRSLASGTPLTLQSGERLKPLRGSDSLMALCFFYPIDFSVARLIVSSSAPLRRRRPSGEINRWTSQNASRCALSTFSSFDFFFFRLSLLREMRNLFLCWRTSEWKYWSRSYAYGDSTRTKQVFQKCNETLLFTRGNRSAINLRKRAVSELWMNSSSSIVVNSLTHSNIWEMSVTFPKDYWIINLFFHQFLILFTSVAFMIFCDINVRV